MLAGPPQRPRPTSIKPLSWPRPQSEHRWPSSCGTWTAWSYRTTLLNLHGQILNLRFGTGHCPCMHSKRRAKLGRHAHVEKSSGSAVSPLTHARASLYKLHTEKSPACKHVYHGRLLHSGHLSTRFFYRDNFPFQTVHIISYPGPLSPFPLIHGTQAWTA